MSDLTYVELTWLKKRMENWIRFGRIVEQHVIDRQHRVVSFAAYSIFAFVRWASNDYGTIVSRVDILRAVQPGERYSTVLLRDPRRLGAARWLAPRPPRRPRTLSHRARSFRSAHAADR